MVNKTNSIDVSVILPCYNEAHLLESSVKTVQAYLDATKYCYEIILFDDGSVDGCKEIGMEIASRDEKIRFETHGRNYGRGRTVADGIRLSLGRIVGYIDIDLEIPAIFMLPAIIAVENGADIAVASRLVLLDSRRLSAHERLRNVPYRFLRRTMTIVYCEVLKYVLGLDIYPEAGLKFYNKERILPLLDQVEDERWFWDTELITRAYYTGLNIQEVECLAIRNSEKKSTVHIARDTIYYVKKIAGFRKVVKELENKRGVLSLAQPELSSVQSEIKEK